MITSRYHLWSNLITSTNCHLISYSVVELSRYFRKWSYDNINKTPTKKRYRVVTSSYHVTISRYHIKQYDDVNKMSRDFAQSLLKYFEANRMELGIVCYINKVSCGSMKRWHDTVRVSLLNWVMIWWYEQNRTQTKSEADQTVAHGVVGCVDVHIVVGPVLDVAQCCRRAHRSVGATSATSLLTWYLF